jgi:hypothetical protein
MIGIRTFAAQALAALIDPLCAARHSLNGNWNHYREISCSRWPLRSAW